MPSQDDLYKDVTLTHGAALGRLAQAYEADPENRRDLLQEIHLALWRSFETFDVRCSLRTWVFRVAHNVAISHVIRNRRIKAQTLISLEEIGEIAGKENASLSIERSEMMEKLFALIQRLNPLDRQVILIYLEGMEATSIGEVTGISAGYTSFAFFNPQGDYATVVLLNTYAITSTSDFAGELGTHIAQRLAGKPAISLAD